MAFKFAYLCVKELKIKKGERDYQRKKENRDYRVVRKWGYRRYVRVFVDVYHNVVVAKFRIRTPLEEIKGDFTRELVSCKNNMNITVNCG